MGPYLELFADRIFGDSLRNASDQLPLRLWSCCSFSDSGVGPVNQQFLHPSLLLIQCGQAVVDFLVKNLIAVDKSWLHLDHGRHS